MKFLEEIILRLFPAVMVKNTQWELIWKEREQNKFVSTIRIALFFGALTYIIHYHTVDRLEGLAPSKLWFNYRYGMATLCLVVGIFYLMPKLYRRFTFYRLPALIVFTMICYLQTKTMIWYPKVPYLYTFVLLCLSPILFNFGTLKNVFYALFNLALCIPILRESGVEIGMIYSGVVVSVVFIFMISSGYYLELKTFLATQRAIDQQKKMIEMDIEFTDQIKAFLPLKISSKINEMIHKYKMNVIQAIDEVLRPQERNIVCLFTDIRNYTKKSRNLKFIMDSMLPNLKEATKIIDSYRGISRKIGDLIFSYYDDEDNLLNILNCLASAIEIQILNDQQNKHKDSTLSIKRYILISSGKAIVGNLSGYRSSIEISALGEPVNFLARVDELTKNNQFKIMVGSDRIILDQSVNEFLLEQQIDLKVRRVRLAENNLHIRDFENVEELFVLSDIISARDIIHSFMNKNNIGRIAA